MQRKEKNMKHFSSTLWLLGYCAINTASICLRPDKMENVSDGVQVAVALTTLIIWFGVWDRIFKSEKNENGK